MDVTLVPSWAEPFGRVVVESMAMGVPVMATNIGGPAELIDDGRDGILLPPRNPKRWAEAIGRLLSHPELRRQIGDAGREKAADFGRGRHAEAVVDVYRSVLVAARRP
jgi:glycosyltransferase involved in cell wall biosynthesis